MLTDNAYSGLNDTHMDVLQEIGNIGAGNAATSLSVMMGTPVDISLPKVNLVGFNEVADVMGGAESIGYGVLVSLEGDIDGMMMFILDKRFAHQILNVLMGGSYENFDELDEISFSAIKEIGNILSASYVNSIAELTGLRINLSVPSVSIDMIGAMLNVPIVKFGAIGDKVLFIEEQFCSNQEVASSHMVLFAEIESLNLILRKLGLM
ncbi:MAG: chemotaxis protein CheC [Oscillospiraceae bacterium]|nr:chemotaxis protein CheC [Oscillospiraceae bacterium]